MDPYLDNNSALARISSITSYTTAPTCFNCVFRPYLLHWIRLEASSCNGPFVTLREVSFYDWFLHDDEHVILESFEVCYHGLSFGVILLVIV